MIILRVHAEAPQEDDKEEKEDGDGDEEKDDAEEGGDDEEEEEEEPEDVSCADPLHNLAEFRKSASSTTRRSFTLKEHELILIQIAPAIREDCQNGECAKLAAHFQACQDKVEAGKGWQGEDCVDEMFHMMHCVDVSDPLVSV